MSIDTTAAPAHVGPRSIGDELERVRLEHHAARIGFVIDELRALSAARAPQGPIPVALHQAINGFSQELETIGRRLRVLTGARFDARAVAA